MTDTPQVTEADDEAAAGLLKVWGIPEIKQSGPLARAFAAHREQSTAALQAENARLRKAVSALCRVMGPINMTLAERECIDEPLPREAVILSFMGSGASDSVTVGEFEDAMALTKENQDD